jgi:hypothetical protein
VPRLLVSSGPPFAVLVFRSFASSPGNLRIKLVWLLVLVANALVSGIARHFTLSGWLLERELLANVRAWPLAPSSRGTISALTGHRLPWSAGGGLVSMLVDFRLGRQSVATAGGSQSSWI